MAQFEPYRLRPVRPLELLRHEGWRLKCYGVSARGGSPSRALIDQAHAIARQSLPTPASTSDRYGVGWLIIHDGAEGDYVLVDWWSHQDIVQHRVFGAPKGAGPLRAGWPQGAGFCVWELAVCWHERQAWIRHVLARSGQPDIDAYLADLLAGEV